MCGECGVHGCGSRRMQVTKLWFVKIHHEVASIALLINEITKSCRGHSRDGDDDNGVGKPHGNDDGGNDDGNDETATTRRQRRPQRRRRARRHHHDHDYGFWFFSPTRRCAALHARRRTRMSWTCGNCVCMWACAVGCTCVWATASVCVCG